MITVIKKEFVSTNSNKERYLVVPACNPDFYKEFFGDEFKYIVAEDTRLPPKYFDPKKSFKDILQKGKR